MDTSSWLAAVLLLLLLGGGYLADKHRGTRKGKVIEKGLLWGMMATFAVLVVAATTSGPLTTAYLIVAQILGLSPN